MPLFSQNSLETPQNGIIDKSVGRFQAGKQALITYNYSISVHYWQGLKEYSNNSKNIDHILP